LKIAGSFATGIRVSVVGLGAIGRFLVVAGLAAFALGLVFMAGGRLGLGRLPGDFVIRGGRATVFVPLATSIVLSIVLTVVLNLLARWRR
jgi:hypothetical protein